MVINTVRCFWPTLDNNVKTSWFIWWKIIYQNCNDFFRWWRIVDTLIQCRIFVQWTRALSLISIFRKEQKNCAYGFRSIIVINRLTTLGLSSGKMPDWCSFSSWSSKKYNCKYLGLSSHKLIDQAIKLSVELKHINTSIGTFIYRSPKWTKGKHIIIQSTILPKMDYNLTIT